MCVCVYMINIFSVSSVLVYFVKNIKPKCGTRAISFQWRCKLCEFYGLTEKTRAVGRMSQKIVESNGIDWIAFTSSGKDLCRGQNCLSLVANVRC